MTRIRIRRLDQSHSGTRYGQVGRLNTSGEYIPVFCIPTLDLRRTKQDIKHRVDNFRTTKDLAYIKGIHNCTLGHISLDEINLFDGPGEEAIKGYIRQIPGELREYVNEEITDFNVNYYSSRSMYTASYSTMVDYIGKDGWFVDDLGNKRYLVSKGFIASRNRYDDNEAYEALFCLMIRRDAVKYYKQCLVLGLQPIGEIFSLYVNSNFVRAKGSINEGFRRFYNKNIKPTVESKGLNVTFVNNPWKSILQSIEKPTFRSIREEKQWLKSCTSKFLETINPQPKAVDPDTHILPQEGIFIPAQESLAERANLIIDRMVAGGRIDTDGFREAWLESAVLGTPIVSSPGIGSNEFTVTLSDPIVPGRGLMDQIRSYPTREYTGLLTVEQLQQFMDEFYSNNNDQTESN